MPKLPLPTAHLPCLGFCAYSVWFTLGIFISAWGQTFTERFEDWPADLKIRGTLVLCDTPAGFQRFVESQASSQNRPFPEVSRPWAVIGNGTEEEMRRSLNALATNVESFERWTDLTVHASSSNGQEGETQRNNILWFDSRLANDITEEEWQAAVPVLKHAIDSGGIVGCIGPISASFGKHVYAIASNQSQPFSAGRNIMPDAIIVWKQFHPEGSPAILDQLQPDLRCVTIEAEPDLAIVLRGRKLTVAGTGLAKVFLPASEFLPTNEHILRSREASETRSPEAWLLDWTQWRRDAIERTLPRFPPLALETPNIEKGTLIIVGGGGLPEGLMKRFVDSAGGDRAELVYVPCLEEDEAAREGGMLETWKRMGIAKCSMLHTKDRNRANNDAEFLAPLQTATGIWFGGGRQWNFADSYYGTSAHRMMKEVLARGGVIGGSSAGASIQANYLARATPIDNFRIMAPGYERGGLGFVRGVAIDQHFTQRSRQKDLRLLVHTYPQILGIGIDESTAIIVRNSIAEVAGKGDVYFFSARQEDGLLDPNRLIEQHRGEGNRFDLRSRTWLPQPEKSH
ncbi:MAG: cyanophycinase [Planctomycetota bacterium]